MSKIKVGFEGGGGRTFGQDTIPLPSPPNPPPLWTNSPKCLLASAAIWPSSGMSREEICNTFVRLIIVIVILLIIFACYIKAVALLVIGLFLIACAGWIFCGSSQDCSDTETIRVEHYQDGLATAPLAMTTGVPASTYTYRHVNRVSRCG